MRHYTAVYTDVHGNSVLLNDIEAQNKLEAECITRDMIFEESPNYSPEDLKIYPIRKDKEEW